MPDLLIAVVLGIVEGLTEFVPVSSTGHLILAGHLLDFTGARADTFQVVIQLGAILAIVVLYWRRLTGLLTFNRQPGFQGQRGLLLLGVTTLPALVLGAVAHGAIKEHLFSPLTVAIGLAVGGALMIVAERWLPAPSVHDLDQFRVSHALLIGLLQCLALWPGMSRSAVTLLGGMALGIDRKTAAEFSFLAALPVLTAASVFDLYQNWAMLELSDVPVFATGLVVAFGSALLAIRFFLHLLAVLSLRPFGWYRLAVAGTVLLVLGT
jgi:undecaprenyl-diphosphatase